MKIKWFGTASIAIETKETKILIDPFLPLSGSRTKICPEDYAGYDNILVTHGHMDHISSIPEILEKGNQTVWCTLSPAITLLDRGAERDRITVISPGDTFEIGDMKITVFQGKHIRFDSRLILKTVFSSRMFRFRRNLKWLLKENRLCRENGETVQFLLETEGKRVFIMGSLALDDHTEYPETIDILVLPYQGNSRIKDHAERILERLAPKKVFLDHFDDTFPPISNDIDPSGLEGTVPPEIIIPEYRREYEI